MREFKLSHRIRVYVDDPDSTGRLHYGAWGALRPDQRRQIRALCDECDAFEKAADDFAKQAMSAYHKGYEDGIAAFAKRLKTFYGHLKGKTVGGSVKYHIDQIVKEMAGADTCVCCGDIIPEGRQVCPNCERKDDESG